MIQSLEAYLGARICQKLCSLENRLLQNRLSLFSVTILKSKRVRKRSNSSGKIKSFNRMRILGTPCQIRKIPVSLSLTYWKILFTKSTLASVYHQVSTQPIQYLTRKAKESYSVELKCQLRSLALTFLSIGQLNSTILQTPFKKTQISTFQLIWESWILETFSASSLDFQVVTPNFAILPVVNNLFRTVETTN